MLTQREVSRRSFGTRKERSRVPSSPDPEEDEVKTGKATIVDRQELAQYRLIIVSGAPDIGIFRLHAVNVGTEV